MTEQNQPPIAQADLNKNQVAEKKKISTLDDLINSPKIKNQFAMALPKHMNADRMARILTTEVRKAPALGKCNLQSFLGAAVQCSQLGLEPGGALGHAYLLPFGNGKADDGKSNVQLIIGYRGMIDLARRSGQIISISARTVREGDDFHFEYGLEETLKHTPKSDDDSPITHVYAVAKLKDGGVQFEVMSKIQIDAIMKSSKSVKLKDDGSIDNDKTKSPWATHYEEMAKKTVIRRLFKYLPVSIEIQQAVILDEKAEAGISQDNEMVLDGDFNVVNEDQ